jgi:hypothetical protein
MKTYTSKDQRRRAWYDPSLRLWTMQDLDPAGNQVGDVDYSCDKTRTMEWLKGTGDPSRLPPVTLRVTEVTGTHIRLEPHDSITCLFIRGSIQVSGKVYAIRVGDHVKVQWLRCGGYSGWVISDYACAPEIPAKAAAAPAAIRLATGEGTDFWRISAEVYRAPAGAELDTYGLPMGRRWECGFSHWLHFRSTYPWAKDCS